MSRRGEFLPAEVDKVRALPGGNEWLTKAQGFFMSKKWIRDARQANWDLPWARMDEWADTYWPGGWDQFRIDRYANTNPAPHVNTHLVPHLILVSMGCPPELAFKDHSLTEWCFTRRFDHNPRIGSLSAELAALRDHVDGFVALRAPWDGSLIKRVPKDWTAYDWSNYLPLRKHEREPLTFTETKRGDMKVNWTWGVRGPSRKWLWDERPDLHDQILRVPLRYPQPLSSQSQEVDFPSYDAWRAWSDAQRTALFRGELYQGHPDWPMEGGAATPEPEPPTPEPEPEPEPEPPDVGEPWPCPEPELEAFGDKVLRELRLIRQQVQRIADDLEDA